MALGGRCQLASPVIQRHVHAALQGVALLPTLGRFSQAGTGVEVGCLRSLGALPSRGAPEASSSVNTVIAFPAQISICSELNPTPKLPLEPGGFAVGL